MRPYDLGPDVSNTKPWGWGLGQGDAYLHESWNGGPPDVDASPQTGTDAGRAWAGVTAAAKQRVSL